MANTITKTTLVDGPRNLILLVNITGDGSGDEAGSTLVDRSAFAPTSGTELVVEKIEGYNVSHTIALSFDATADLIFVRLPSDDEYRYDWCKIGGVSSNKAGAGATGDILLTTSGLGSGDVATFYLHMRKA